MPKDLSLDPDTLNPAHKPRGREWPPTHRTRGKSPGTPHAVAAPDTASASGSARASRLCEAAMLRTSMNAGEQGSAPSESIGVAHVVGLETLVEHESCLHPAPASRALDVAIMSYEKVRVQASLLSQASLNGLNRDRAIAVCERAMQLLPAPLLLSEGSPHETALTMLSC